MSKISFLLIAIVFTFTTTNLLYCQEREGIEHVSRLYNHWEWCYDVKIQDNLAFIAAGVSGLQIVDITDPENLEIVGWFDDTPYSLVSVCIVENYVYATDMGQIGRDVVPRGGLLIIDISDSANPELVGMWEAAEDFQPICVTVFEDHAYLGECHRFMGGAGNLRVIDVSDPENSETVWENQDFRNWYTITDVCESGGFLYAAMCGQNQMSHGLLIYDLSDPANPEQVGAYRRDWADIWRVVVSDDYAYVGLLNGIQIFDVSDPANLEQMGFIRSGRLNDLSITGNHICAVGSVFKIIDISDPANPEEINSLNYPVNVLSSVFCLNDIAYATGNERAVFRNYREYMKGTLQAIDVSNPEEPEELTLFSTTEDIIDVELSGSFAYVTAGYDGLKILDVSDPGNPEEIGNCDDIGNANAVCVSGEFAYVAETSDIENGGSLRVIDVSNPENPEVVGSCETDDFTQTICISGEYVYLANFEIDGGVGIYGGSFRVVNISDPENPDEIGEYYVGDQFFDVFVQDEFVYGATRYVRENRQYNGIRILDNSNPEDINQISEIRTQKVAGVFAEGDLLYYVESFSNPRGGIIFGDLVIVDVTNPEDPVEIGRCTIPGKPAGLFVQGDFVFVAGGWAGIRVVNVADPEDPNEVGFYDTPGTASHLKVTEDGFIYLADLTNLGIYEASRLLTGMRVLPINLREGWNLMSINVTPQEEFWEREEGPDVIRMMERLRIDEENHQLLLMKDENGRFYAPGQDFNNIPFWNQTEGYLVKVNQQIETFWRGEPIPLDTDIPLAEGWNYIAYLPEYLLDAAAPNFHVLSPIINNVLIAKDELGHFMSPQFEFSNMPPWRETQGYQIRVDENIVLNYPPAQEGNVIARNIVTKQPQRLLHFVRKDWTGENMSLLITSVNGIQAAEGDQIGAIDLDGNLVGVGKVEVDGRCGLAVWGDDETTDEVDGLISGSEFSLKFWDAETNNEYLLSTISYANGAELVYETDGFVALEAMVKTAIPTDFYLAPISPNPFNNTTIISYGLPEASNSVIRIFDLNGRQVDVLRSSEASAGHHTITWKASLASSGIYFVNIKAGAFSATHKCVLVK